MRLTRWPVLFVALGVAGMLLAPEDAGANVAHDRLARTFAGGAARVLVVNVPRATPLPLAGLPPAPCSRGRGHLAKQDDDEIVTLDQSDPWTGDEIAPERVAAPARRPLDNVDPWNGDVIPVAGTAFAQRESLDPFTAD